jgi:hypothetical protein
MACILFIAFSKVDSRKPYILGGNKTYPRPCPVTCTSCLAVQQCSGALVVITVALTIPIVIGDCKESHVLSTSVRGSKFMEFLRFFMESVLIQVYGVSSLVVTTFLRGQAKEFSRLKTKMRQLGLCHEFQCRSFAIT